MYAVRSDWFELSYTGRRLRFLLLLVSLLWGLRLGFFHRKWTDLFSETVWGSHLRLTPAPLHFIVVLRIFSRKNRVFRTVHKRNILSGFLQVFTEKFFQKRIIASVKGY